MHVDSEEHSPRVHECQVRAATHTFMRAHCSMKLPKNLDKCALLVFCCFPDDASSRLAEILARCRLRRRLMRRFWTCCRQCGSNPGGLETGLEEINGDLLEADFWTISRLVGREPPMRSSVRLRITSGLPVIRNIGETGGTAGTWTSTASSFPPGTSPSHFVTRRVDFLPSASLLRSIGVYLKNLAWPLRVR
jgi:hypothetical protein